MRMCKAMESVNQKYIQALSSLREDDFTRDILKPLFEAMGYERVDFNGGPYERGRDLIAQRKLPPKKEMYVVYVQSKKIGNIQNSSTSSKFSELIHQLRQCCTGSLTNAQGENISPSEVYLACPEQIKNRLLEDIGSQLYNMPVKVEIYDGPRIIADIKEFKPGLLGLLTNIEDKLTSNNDFGSSSEELLQALKSKWRPSLDDFYSDLSFFVGSFDSNQLLHLEMNFNDDQLNIAEEFWPETKNELEKLVDKYQFDFVEKNLKDVEALFRSQKKNYESHANVNLKKKCGSLEIKINDLIERIKSRIKSLAESINVEINPLAKKLSDNELLDRQFVVDCLKSEAQQKSKIRENKSQTTKSPFHKEANLIFSLLSEKNKLEEELFEALSKVVQKPYYNLKINQKSLAEKLAFYKKRYFKSVDKINKRQLNLLSIRKFLLETEITLSFVAKLKAKDFQLSRIITFNQNKSYQDRVSVSPHDIFSTGHDIAVYGGAGVGKTTTLIAYAESISDTNDSKLIYIPLNRLVDEFKKYINNVGDDVTYNKDLLVKIILLSKGLSPTNEYIEDAKKFLTGNLTLMLDGLDEVFNAMPGIIPAISEFKAKNPNSQLIVSSRDCVSYLDEIDFLGITLLPFTKDQLNCFIRGWLKNSDRAEHLIKSIESRELFEYIKTPLLATITCSLVEKGINAPSTENEIYSERLSLLTGEYDVHKNISRQNQSGKQLRKCAVKIAFYMHSKGVRSLQKSKMVKVLRSSFSSSYSDDLLSECLDELINPCNVIVIDTMTSTYNFGHFRFQEHLASEELKINRNIDLSELATNDWWRGALCLYSQDSDISYLIEDVYKRYGSLDKATISLNAMIDQSPMASRRGLRELLKQYEIADSLDALFLSDYSDDY